MKKHLLIAISLLMVSFASWSQTEVFNNGGAGNNLYSNAENWNNNVLPADNGVAQFNATASLDVSAKLSQIRSAAQMAGITGGDGTLMVTGDGLVVPFLQNSPEAGGEFLIDANVIFQTTNPDAEPIGRSLIRVDGADGIITFGSSSDLTLNSPVRMLAQGTEKINMDGILRGDQSIQIGGNTNVFFGSTSDNSNFQGDIVFVGTTQNVEVNTAKGNVFMPSGRKVQINGSGGTLALNGANIYQGSFSVGGDNSFTLKVNKNQPSMGNLILGTGTLTLDIGAEVDTVAFSNSAGDETGSLWDASGSIVIQNFKNAVLRFGTTVDGLTATQLGQVNIGGATPVLNSNGFLIDPALNTAPEATEIQNLTLAEGFSQRVIDLSKYFSDPQNDDISFSAISSENFVSVSVTDSLLTITESANGTSIITITCMDEFQSSTNATFSVNVDVTVADSDGDGTPDDTDSCPNTPSGETVDANGCADSQKDTDNDGVTDDLDQCSGTSSGEAVDGDGCADSQKDSDNDGVADDTDQCPDTASGATVDADGCADAQKDSDGDGVTDDLDLCSDTSSEATVDANGCVVLSNNLRSSKVYVYPNPATNQLMVKNINKWEGGILVIHDMSGSLVLYQEIQQGQNIISIQQLKVGKYILQLQKGTEREMLTFLRNN